MADNTYDGIILDAGHKKLVLQAYVGRAGLNVLCLERWQADFLTGVRDILVPNAMSPPPEQRRALLERTAEG